MIDLFGQRTNPRPFANRREDRLHKTEIHIYY